MNVLLLYFLNFYIFLFFRTIRVLEEFIQVTSTLGFYKSVCYSYEQSSVSAHWYLFFAVSKIAELIDTLFLVLRKRPLTFLHCYHHCSVMVYTFHSGSEQAAGRWFIAMNFFAHR